MMLLNLVVVGDSEGGSIPRDERRKCSGKRCCFWQGGTKDTWRASGNLGSIVDSRGNAGGRRCFRTLVKGEV